MTNVTHTPKATASPLVRTKAVALHEGGKVRRTAEDQFSVTYRVRADHGLTYTVLQNRENIDADRCTCAWNRYQPFNEAVCSHVLAARLEQAMPTPRLTRVLLWLAERIGK